MNNGEKVGFLLNAVQFIIGGIAALAAILQEEGI